MAKRATAKRAERRHHLQRMKAKAKHVSKITGGNFDRWYNHLAGCSCHGCGNPRKHFGELTMQERRHTT